MIDCKTKGGFLLGVLLKLFGFMRVRLSVNRNVQLIIEMFNLTLYSIDINRRKRSIN